jgi:hypothetical protein
MAFRYLHLLLGKGQEGKLFFAKAGGEINCPFGERALQIIVFRVM